MSEDVHGQCSQETGFVERFATKICEWEALLLCRYSEEGLADEAAARLRDQITGFLVDEIFGSNLIYLQKHLRTLDISPGLRETLCREVRDILDP